MELGVFAFKFKIVYRKTNNNYRQFTLTNTKQVFYLYYVSYLCITIPPYRYTPPNIKIKLLALHTYIHTYTNTLHKENT